MKNFEPPFSVQVAKFNAMSETTKLPEYLTALLLLSNSAINGNQRISVLAAAAPADIPLDGVATNDQFLAAVTFQSVASVVKQFKMQEVGKSMQASAADTSYKSGHRYPASKNNSNRKNISHLKKKSPFCSIQTVDT